MGHCLTRRLAGLESLEDRCLLTAAAFPQAPPNDPLFSQQWNLQNTGQTGGTPGADINVLPAWAEGYTGKGVTVGVVDSGVYHDHPDLAANYRPDLSYNFFNNTSDPAPPLDSLLQPYGPDVPSGPNSHGTEVAGLIAAVANNGVGTAGVAPDAQFGAERLITEDPSGSLVQGGDSQSAEALLYHNQQIDIYNNSWGYTGPATSYAPYGTGSLGPADPKTIAAMQQGATSGRGGLGNIYVFSAGNDNSGHANTNYEAETASRYAITVGALGDDGKQSVYSNPGASVLVSAPGGHDASGPPDLASDEIGLPAPSVVAQADPDTPGNEVYEATYDQADSWGMNGTSAAAPQVSGVVALMLQANPKLSWRDVQEILAESATQNDPTDSGWMTNGYGFTSDGAIVPLDSTGASTVPLPSGVAVSRFHVDDKYGFGLLNAKAAVDLAKTWTPLQAESTLSSGLITLPTAANAIPDGVATGTSSSVTFTGGLHVEHAEVVLNAAHPARGDLQVTLISPNGTRSVLAATRDFHQTINGAAADVSYDLTFDSKGNLVPAANYTNWSMSTVQDWGQSSAGTWTLVVADQDDNGQVGTFTSWTLNLYGSQDYAPVAQDVTLATQQNASTSVNLLSHTYDTDGSVAPGSLTIVSQPAGGTLSVDPQTGEVLYTPNFNYHGLDSFTYTVLDDEGVASRTATVSIDVGLNLLNPVANDDVTSTTYATPVAIQVLANDTDLSGTLTPSTVTIVKQPQFGTVQVNRITGVVLYTPNSNFTVGDTFTYTVTDSNGKTSNVATVTINLAQPAPVAHNLAPPAAGVNVTQQVNVLANVSGSANPSTVTILTPAQHGKTVIDPVTGVIAYTPDPNYFGSDSFAYGVENFQGVLSNPATVSLSVLAQGLPLAVNHEFVLVPGVRLIDGLRALDNPTGSGGLTSMLVGQAAFGTVALNADGSFVYNQGPNFQGLDRFYYQVSNGVSSSNVATVRLVSPNFHYIERLYQSVLNRSASDADIMGWVVQLNAGVSRQQVASVFLNSAEYETHLINSIYENLLSRPVDPGGLGFWLGQMQAGVSPETITVAIASSSEYLARHGGTTQGQVTGFYQDLLGRAASFTDILYWSDQIAAGTPAASVAAAFVASNEYRTKLISSYYTSYLGHTPDLGGLNHWLSDLAVGYPRSFVQAGILSSGEYFTQS